MRLLLLTFLLGSQVPFSDAEESQNAGFEDAFLSFAKTAAAAKQQGKLLPQFSTAYPNATLAQAEIAQRHYVKRLLDSESLAGIKGAVAGEGGQKFFGIDGPLSALLFKSGWHQSKDSPTINVRPGALPGVETELGILLKTAITKEVNSVEALKEKVHAIVPIVELPAGLHNWPQKPKATDLVAANVDSDQYIVGKPHQDLDTDIDSLPIELKHNQVVQNTTTGGDAKNGQWWNFLHQVNWAVRQGYPLEPGHLIITGALGKIYKGGPGEYQASFGKLGEISFSLKQE